MLTPNDAQHRNPILADERARTREDLLAATEKQLAAIAARIEAGTLAGAEHIGVAVGKVLNKYKVGKHFEYEITDSSFTYHRKQSAIDSESALDGIYVIRTNVTDDHLDAAGVVNGYKNLAHVERDFRSIKTDDLDLRPIHHHLEDRVKAHVLLAMLARYLIWHLRQAWAPLTFTDAHPPARDNPVAPAQRSHQARAKASRQHDQTGQPYRNFPDLLEHLKTLTRNQVRFPESDIEVPMLAEATPEQRRAFELIGTPIPLTLEAT